MSASWSAYVLVFTLVSMAATLWLLFSNRNKSSTGEELDHDFDGIHEYDNPLPAWWVSLFVLTVIFGVGYVFYYPALGNLKGAGNWSSVKEWTFENEKHEERFAKLYNDYAAQSPQELVADRRAMQTGRRLFLNNCATCHGVTAKGSDGFPNLTDSEWLWGAEFEQIKHSIGQGRVGAMPPWGQVLSAEQVDDVSQYVLTLSNNQPSEAGVGDGEKTYATYCAACHGAQGKGMAALGAPDLSNDSWLYGGTVADIAESIQIGRAGVMPAHVQILSENKVHLIAAYVFSLQSHETTNETRSADKGL